MSRSLKTTLDPNFSYIELIGSEKDLMIYYAIFLTSYLRNRLTIKSNLEVFFNFFPTL